MDRESVLWPWPLEDRDSRIDLRRVSGDFTVAGKI